MSSLQTRIVLVFVLVKVNVRVRQAVVTVLVYVNFAISPRRAPKCTDTQSDDHQRNAKLEPATDPHWNRDTQRQHYDRDDQKRRGVSGTPERADQCGTEDVLMPAHNRRNRHDVIDFRCVF